jgi:glycosyltransferase involved in cell wall biosynthesis
MNNEKFELSIVIPTYNNTQYLDECIDSILSSGDGFKYEVLFGIDGCDKSLEYFKNKTLPENFKVYLFTENGGPYTIKNTLASISQSDTLMFFDSDDIMNNLMISNTLTNIKKYTCIKPKLINFNEDSGNINLSRSKLFGEGVFSIVKSTFISMNGFEPWICAADSDFMGRLYKSKVSMLHTPEVMFYRRLHSYGLTSRPETGFRSILRSKYARISKQKVGPGNPNKLHIREFSDVSLITGPVEFTKNSELDSRSNLNIVGQLLRPGEPRKRVEPKEINYDSVNKNEGIKQNTVIKNNKLTPKNRQELIDSKKNSNSLNSTSKNMFNNKPNRRLDLPNVNLGRDNLRIN